jgi:hypothetical protein
MVAPAQRRVNRMALSLLGSATRSVPDFVRTDLRTVRLAIACGDRSNSAMHPSQVAGGDTSTFQHRGMSELGGSFEGGAPCGKGRASARPGLAGTKEVRRLDYPDRQRGWVEEIRILLV